MKPGTRIPLAAPLSITAVLVALGARALSVSENEPQPSFTRIETNQPLTAGVDLNYRFR